MRRKWLLKSICCVFLCAVLLVPLLIHIKAEDERELKIYNTLVAEFRQRGAKSPEAIACGILGNIFAETGGSFGYDPTTTGDYDKDKGYDTSGGICGWHNENWTKMSTWCQNNGYPWFILESGTKKVYQMVNGVQTRITNVTDSVKLEMIEGQVKYLVTDLYGNSFNDTRPRILAVENDIHGAWYVGYIYCCMCERPADKWNGGIIRGKNAQTFWKYYVNSGDLPIMSGDPNNSTLQIFPDAVPNNNSTVYNAFNISGMVTSNYPIRNASVYVTDVDGNKKIEFAQSAWDSRTFDIRWDGANTIAFSKLSTAGSYIYCIDAQDVSGKTDSYRHIFYIISPTICYVSYDTEGGGAISDVGVIFGDSITLPAAPTKTGYIFAGWSDGTATYPAGETYRVLNSQIKLTAQWTACQHDFGDAWQYDENGHWQVCTCGVSSTPQSHSFTDTVTAATPEAQGYTTHTCTVCAYSYVDGYTDYVPDDPTVRIEVEPYSAGDVNGDGYLDGGDMTALSRYLTGGTMLSDEAAAAADVDSDGFVNSADLVALARRLLKGS